MKNAVGVMRATLAVALCVGVVSVAWLLARSWRGVSAEKRAMAVSAIAPSETPAPPASAVPPPIADVVTIAANTMATFGEVKIGVGNIRRPRSVEADAELRTAALWISVGDTEAQNQTLRVHAGDEFDAAGQRFQVRAVRERAVELVSRR